MSTTSDVIIDYTNHRGERRERRIRPTGLIWHPEGTEWHKGPQWILWAVDLEPTGSEPRPVKGFAMTGIHSWKPVSE